MKRKASHFLFLIIGASLLMLTNGVRGGNKVKAKSENLDLFLYTDSLSELGSGFTYQGYLTEGGSPANGIYDFSFELFDSETGPGSLGLIEVHDVEVDSGVYTAILDFGPGVFKGEDRWLQIGALPDGAPGEFIPIEGRQLLRPVPYALYSKNAGYVHWSNVTNRPPGLNNGDQDTTYSAGFGLELTGTTFNVMTGTIQTRVDDGCGVGSTVRVVNADGAVECETHDTRPVFSRTALDTSDDVGYYTDIAIGVDGLPVVSYFDVSNGTLKVARCNDIACTHSTINTVDPNPIVGMFTSITIGVDGLPIISYYDYSNEDLKVAHCDDPLCSNTTITPIDPSPDMVGGFTSITIGSDGLPIISYWNYSQGDLKVAHCDNTACTSASIIDLDTTLSVGLYTSITIGVDKLPIISYIDASNNNLNIAHCHDVYCTDADISVIDTGTAGKGSSIAIGRDGLPIISYIDLIGQSLKVANCTDITCSSASPHYVDIGDSFGDFTSIIIGADGLPIIGYYNANNGDLKVAHCDDQPCSTARINIVDSDQDVGNFPSIQIGTDGMPIISYYNISDGDLKMTHCSNVFCIPYWRRR